MVTHGNKRQPSQNSGDGHHVGDRVRLRLIEQLRPTLACLPPPRGGAPAGQRIDIVYTKVGSRFARFKHSLDHVLTMINLVCTMFVVGLLMVYTKLQTLNKNAILPARRIII